MSFKNGTYFPCFSPYPLPKKGKSRTRVAGASLKMQLNTILPSPRQKPKLLTDVEAEDWRQEAEISSSSKTSSQLWGALYTREEAIDNHSVTCE